MIWDWKGYKVAPFVCYDLRFPEWFRKASALGAELFVVIANWPGKRVALFAEDVEAFGKTHRVVRVKPLVPPEPEKPEPAAPALTDAAEIEDHEIDAEDEIPLGLDDE